MNYSKMDVHCQRKIMEWQETKEDFPVSCLVSLSLGSRHNVSNVLTSKGIDFSFSAGDIASISNIPISRLSEVADLQDVIKIELSRRLNLL